MTRNIIVILIVVIVLGFAGLIIQSALKPKPYVWMPSYLSFDKQPYGTSVLFGQLENFFPGKRIKRLSDRDLKPYYDDFLFDLSINNDQYEDGQTNVDDVEYEDEYDDDTYEDGYEDENDDQVYVESQDQYEEEDTAAWDDEEGEYLYEDYNEEMDSTFSMTFKDSIPAPPFNFLFIGRSFTPSHDKARALYQHIYQGNHALLAAVHFQKYVMDYLDIELGGVELVHMEDESTIREYVVKLNTVDEVEYKPFNEIAFFEKYPENAEVIATNGEGRTVGLTLTIGKGKLTLFSMPILFTNYYVLKQDRTITSELLTHMPNENTYWAHYISDKPMFNYPEQRSILAFIHSQESLTWAFYVLLFSLLIFFIFQIKRKQRKIPVVLPPENTSVKFTNTLSNLYLIRRDNKDILVKKMNYFLMRVRDKYHIDTNIINEEFMKKLAVKSQVKLGVIKLLFYRYETYSKQDGVSADDFLEVNKLFQDFKLKENE